MPTVLKSGSQVRVGKNVNAEYSVTVDYNGSPTLHVEEKLDATKTKWTYDISIDSGATCNPSGTGEGKPTSITAQSPTAGTYTITAKYYVTFTIDTPVKDSNGNYVYNSDGTQQFTTRTDGPHSGSGSATLNVKDGKFKIRLQPASTHEFPGRSYTKFGVGETGAIVVEKENASDPYTPVFQEATSSDPFSFTLDGGTGPGYTAASQKGSSTISVWATINGQREGPETLGVEVLEPSGIVMKHVASYDTQNAKGMALTSHLRPTTVSFKAVEIIELECPASQGSTNLQPHKRWTSGWAAVGDGNTQTGALVKGPNSANSTCNEFHDFAGVSGTDLHRAPEGKTIWDIPWHYRMNGNSGDGKKFTTVRQVLEIKFTEGLLRFKNIYVTKQNEGPVTFMTLTVQ